jgi:hypothetical protein
MAGELPIIEGGSALVEGFVALNSSRQAAFTAVANRILDRHMARLGGDEKAAYAEALREIGLIMFDASGRAMAHINHFIGATGAAVDVPLDRLLSEDSSVKDRVIEETYRRALRIPTVREQASLNRQAAGLVSLIHPSGIDPEITIFQHNFSNTDWWGALGTYTVKLEVVGQLTERSSSVAVLLQGENLYTWHPNEDRSSKRVHEIGARLEQLGGGKSFPMRSKPTMILVDTSRAAMLRLTTMQQTNPNPGRGLTRDQISRLMNSLAR